MCARGTCETIHMLQQEIFLLHPPQDVRSNTHYAYHMITPSAVCPLNHRLHPLERYKRQCGDHTVYVWDLIYQIVRGQEGVANPCCYHRH